jgi:RNA polymerase sigma-70 factor, ECF subfamily
MSGEEDLLARAKRGDRTAFGMLVKKHHRRVYATALHIMGNHAEADDVTQEAFLRAYRGMASFDGRSDLFTWLYRITVNTALNHIRSQKRVDSIARAGAEEVGTDGLTAPERPGARERTPREWAELGQEVQAVLDALWQLSPTLRVTLVLATVEGLPYRKIAELLEIPEGTVAWRVNEARAKLRLILSGTPDEVPPGKEKTLEDPRK